MPKEDASWNNNWEPLSEILFLSQTGWNIAQIMPREKVYQLTEM